MATVYRYVRLYLPGPALIDRVSRVMTTFEAVYNTMIWLPEDIEELRLNPHGAVRFGRRTSVLSLASKRFDADIYAFIDSPVNPRAALKLKYAAQVRSVEIGFSGLGEAIDATAEVLDPLRRKARKERLRHRMAMNEAEEVEASYHNQLKSLDVLDKQAEMVMKLSKWAS